MRSNNQESEESPRSLKFPNIRSRSVVLNHDIVEESSPLEERSNSRSRSRSKSLHASQPFEQRSLPSLVFPRVQDESESSNNKSMTTPKMALLEKFTVSPHKFKSPSPGKKSSAFFSNQHEHLQPQSSMLHSLSESATPVSRQATLPPIKSNQQHSNSRMKLKLSNPQKDLWNFDANAVYGKFIFVCGHHNSL